MNAELEVLSARIEKLEHQNRRLKRAGLAAMVVAGVVALSSMSAVVCRTVYGERFVLQDSGGNERAVMTAYETGGLPQFTLLDQKGRKALSFGVAENGRGYIEVAGNDGKMTRSHFAIGAEGNATIEQPAPKQDKKAEGAASVVTR
jgi:hypothetical protein